MITALFLEIHGKVDQAFVLQGQNEVRDAIGRGINSVNACYYSVRALLPSRPFSRSAERLLLSSSSSSTVPRIG